MDAKIISYDRKAAYAEVDKLITHFVRPGMRSGRFDIILAHARDTLPADMVKFFESNEGMMRVMDKRLQALRKRGIIWYDREERCWRQTPTL